MKPKALIIYGYGINTQEETKYVFDETGSEGEIVHINDIISGNKKLSDYQIMVFPGGFSYGDDTGSGNAIANKMKNNIKEEILKFAQEDKLVIGICNGMQMLVNLGLIPANDQKYGEIQATLMHNTSVRYECRWVWLKNTSEKCVWTKGIDLIHCAVAHGEGNFYAEPEVMKTMKENDQIVFKYVDQNGAAANGGFPINPNGAIEDIAGVCDESGRIFGMMPHPERFIHFTNEEGWELKKEILIRQGKEIPNIGDRRIFENAAKYFQ